MCNKIHYKIIYNWLGTIFVFLRCYSTIFVCLGFVFLQTPRNNSKNIRHLKFSTRRIVEGAKFTHPTYLFSVCTPCAIRYVHAGREKDLRTFFFELWWLFGFFRTWRFVLKITLHVCWNAFCVIKIRVLIYHHDAIDAKYYLFTAVLNDFVTSCVFSPRI